MLDQTVWGVLCVACVSIRTVVTKPDATSRWQTSATEKSATLGLAIGDRTKVVYATAKRTGNEIRHELINLSGNMLSLDELRLG